MSVKSDIGPWGIMPRALIRDLAGDTAAMAVYGLLSSYADRQTDDGWTLGRKQICDETGLGLTTVKRCLGVLRDKGWLDIQHTTTSDGDQGWSRYFVRLVRGSESDQGGSAERPTPRHQATHPGRSDDHIPIPLVHTSQTEEEGVATAPPPTKAQIGRLIAKEWYDGIKAKRGNPPTSPKFMAVAKMAENALSVYPPEEVLAALVSLYERARPITGQTLDELLSHRARQLTTTASMQAKNDTLDRIRRLAAGEFSGPKEIQS